MRWWMPLYLGTVAAGILAFKMSSYTLTQDNPFSTAPVTAGIGMTADSESQRIQNRLILIEELLRAKDVSHLSSELQAQRKKNLDVLHAYWQKGQFPKNTNRPGQRIPFFIDAYGTPCAVGHLIIESGHRDLAMEVAKADNNIYADRITDPRFAAWAASSGLTLEELSLIQPNYDWVTPAPAPRRPFQPQLVHLPNDVTCFTSGVTYIMKDTSSSCGEATKFCMTPLSCFSNSSRRPVGGSVIACRAVPGNGSLSCPSPQICADDPKQQFIAEADSEKWANPGGPNSGAIAQLTGPGGPNSGAIEALSGAGGPNSGAISQEGLSGLGEPNRAPIPHAAKSARGTLIESAVTH